MTLCIVPPSGSCEGKEEDKLTIQRDFVIEDNGRLTAYHGPGGEVTIPEGVLKIGEGAFAGSAALTGVTVPEGAEEIEKEAFLGCAGLRRVGTCTDWETRVQGLRVLGGDSFSERLMSDWGKRICGLRAA